MSYHGTRETRHTDWSGELTEHHYGPGQVWEKIFPAGAVEMRGNNGGDGSYVMFASTLANAPTALPVPLFHMPGEEYFGGNRAESFGGNVADLPMGDSPYTIEMFVKPEANVGDGGMIFWGECGNGGSKAMALRFFGGPSRFRHYWWGNDLDTNTPSSLADGQYHHIAVTYDGTTRSQFVDHVLLNSDTPGTHRVAVKDNFVIGKTHCNQNLEFFRGYIKDVKIHARALSASEMQVA